MKKLIGSQSSQSNRFVRLVSDRSFGVSFELETNYHVQLKIYFCFHGPFLKRIDMLCKLWFALFLGFFFSVISVNAWQGLKSWYTITMAFGLVSQAQAKNHSNSSCCSKPLFYHSRHWTYFAESVEQDQPALKCSLILLLTLLCSVINGFSQRNSIYYVSNQLRSVGGKKERERERERETETETERDRQTDRQTDRQRWVVLVA